MIVAQLLLLSVAGATVLRQSEPPTVTWFNHSDNVYARAAWKADNKVNHIKFLGVFSLPPQCEAACVAHGPACRSFTHHGEDNSTPSFTGQCFGVMNDWWHPSLLFPNATSGKLKWCPSFKSKSTCPPSFCRWSGAACVPPPTPAPAPPPPPPPPQCPRSSCASDVDCSLNGVCQAQGRCECDAAWTGACCATLNLDPAVRGAGLHTLEADGHNTSSWGGAVIRDNATGIYHMWAAEMTRHCGGSSTCSVQ